MTEFEQGPAETNGRHDATPCPAVTRRGFLRKGASAVAGASALAAALSPLRHLRPGDLPSLEQMLQKHYKEMTPEERQAVLDRIAREVKDRYGIRPTITDPPPMDGVEFVYALNISRCIGCRKCVHACVKENNESRAPEIQYIRVLKMEKGSIDVETSDHHYDPPQVPEHDSYYMPVQCHQCKKPPCVKVCPVGATWQEPDGITVIDYDWCIGCRYCEAACPYWARRFNFAEPQVPRDQLTPEMAYLSNRPRRRGVMEKCTFCLQRTRRGRMPACVEVCPTGSRKFGNVLDPDSEVAYILREKRVFILKEEVGTLPRFFYYFDERGSRYREPIGPVTPGGGA
ncbi:MAG: 4Fe-4S dicluster domain-containing protein [Phycisphaerae bacterium]